MIQSKIANAFESQFGQKPLMFIAPGRINLLGEHTDYNEGFVMPAAIDKHFLFAIAPSGNNIFTFNALDLNEKISFSLDQLNSGNRGGNYLMGVIDAFKRKGKKISGVNCLFSSTIPSGAGLSSSAALCSGLAFALNEIFKCGLGKLELALIAQEAEHRFAGTKCGIMDMYASLFSKEGSIMLLDCRSNTHEDLKVNFDGFEILLIDTKVKHTHNESGYNNRRAACEEGVRLLQTKYSAIKSLRDVNAEMLESNKSLLSEDVYIKCFYVVHEIERTKKAAELLKLNDLIGFGKLMYKTHWGLSKEYKVSCEESDWLVDWASENRVTGARQMGGGFGGCTINLVKKESVQTLTEDVLRKYVVAFKKEPDFYQVQLSTGVHKTKSVLDWRER
jgi:galactokinase